MELCVFTEPQQGARYADLLAMARTAQDAGLDGFFRSDHYQAMGEGDGAPGPTDAWTSLTALAAQTSTLRLGTLVSPATFRLPGPLAIQVAQVDQISGGRAELGLGAGWYEQEHRSYGIPFPATGERFDRFAEQLEIITGLWSTPAGAQYSFAGEHYTLTDSPALPKPVQTRVPVIVGGGGKKRTPALAARFATEYNTGFSSVEVSAERYARVRQVCEDAGRDPGTLKLSWAGATFVGQDDAEVRQRTGKVGHAWEDVAQHGLGGSPGQVVDRIGRLAELGVTRVYTQLLDLSDLAHVELIGERVLPAFR